MKKSLGYKLKVAGVICLIIAILIGVDYYTTHHDYHPVITSLVSHDKSVTIKWKKLPGAKWYKVWKRDMRIEDSEDYHYVAYLDKNQNTYTDERIEYGNEWRYFVACQVGSLVIKSKKRYIVPLEIESPKKVSLKQVGSTVNISWSAKKGNTYKVLRKRPGGTYKTLTTITADQDNMSYIDKKAKKKSYVYNVVQTQKSLSYDSPGGFKLSSHDSNYLNNKTEITVR